MGYDPAIHEARAPVQARRYAEDYVVPRRAPRLDLALERCRIERTLARTRRRRLVKQAREDVERWKREGRDIIAIVADLYILLEAATQRNEPAA